MAKKKAKAPKRSMKKAVKKAVKKSVKKVVRKVAAKTAPKKAVKKAPAARGFALQSAAPGFTVNDAAVSIAWYQNVLGFAVAERWEHEGTLHGASMRSGNVTVNLGQDDWKLGRDRIKGAGMRMYITTGPEIDKLADQIKARGGTLAQEPADEWGMRTFSINDPDGFKLTFMATPAK